jgi:O-antigen/teichoic acid export membrane protein
MKGADEPQSLTSEPSIFSRAVAAGKWALAGELVARLAQPVILLVLARLLLPEDFGLATVAAMLASFSQAFWDAGLAKALVQSNAPAPKVDQMARAACQVNLVLALALYGAIIASSGWIGRAFGDERVGLLICVQGLAIPLGAVGAVPAALLQRSLRYRTIFAARFGTAIAPGLVGVPLALMGAGYWALVAGSVAGALVQTGLFFGLARWWPATGGGWQEVRGLVRFASWSAGEAVVSWAMLWLDALVVGLLFSSHELGLFRVGSTTVAMAYALPIGSLMPVLFVALSRLQDEPARLEEAFLKATKGVTMVAMTILVLGVVAPFEWSALVFGETWREMGLIVGFVTVIQAGSWMVAPCVELYRAKGRPDINLKIVAGSLAVYIPVLFWAGQGGMETFLWARLGVGLAGQAVHWGAVWKVAVLPPGRIFKTVGRFVAAAVGGGLTGAGVCRYLAAGDGMKIAAATCAGLAVFSLIGLSERHFVLLFLKRLAPGERRYSPAVPPSPSS